MQGLEEVLVGVGRGSHRGWKRFTQGLKRFLQVLAEIYAGVERGSCKRGVGRGSCRGWKRFSQGLEKVLACVGRDSYRVWFLSGPRPRENFMQALQGLGWEGATCMDLDLGRRCLRAFETFIK